jgi:hypothetical protein
MASMGESAVGTEDDASRAVRGVASFGERIVLANKTAPMIVVRNLNSA